MYKGFYETPESLKDAVDEYFKQRTPELLKDDQGNAVTDSRGRPVWKTKPPTVSGLSLFLGFVSKQSFYDQEKRGEEFARVVEYARTKLTEHHEENLSTRDHCTGDIFWMKNFGWRDEMSFSGDMRVASVALSAEEEEAFKRNMALFFGGSKDAGQG